MPDKNKVLINHMAAAWKQAVTTAQPNLQLSLQEVRDRTKVERDPPNIKLGSHRENRIQMSVFPARELLPEMGAKTSNLVKSPI